MGLLKGDIAVVLWHLGRKIIVRRRKNAEDNECRAVRRLEPDRRAQSEQLRHALLDFRGRNRKETREISQLTYTESSRA